MTALVSLEADVVFLSEYYRSESQQVDEDTQLERAGFKVKRTPESASHYKEGNNQILVAARQSITLEQSAADKAPDYALDNYCHITLSGVDLIGLRIPAYDEGTKAEIEAQNEAHWEWLDRTLKPLVSGRSIVLGDMNRDPDSVKQSVFFTRMKDAGWQTKRPVGHPWSYRNRNIRRSGKEHKGKRIDHAFFGQAFELDEVHVQYYASTDNDALTGSDIAISDHAALAVDVPLR